MKKTRLLMIFAVILAMLLFAITASAETLSGWQDNGDGTMSYYYEDGSKAIDTELYDGEYLYRVDKDGIMLENEWYTRDDGCIYYFDDDGRALMNGVFEIDGNMHYFYDNGMLLVDSITYIYNDSDDTYYVYYAAADGKLARNSWRQPYKSQEDESWFYFGDDCTAYVNGVFKIGSSYYAFDYNGYLVVDTIYYVYNEETDENDIYYAQSLDFDGKLAINKWVQPHTEYDDYCWYYFGADGKAYMSGVYKIGKYYYGFEGGAMYDDTTFSYGEYNDELDCYVTTGSYKAKAGGRLYVNEWSKDPDDGLWSYYGEGGKAPQGAATIGGKKYCFSEGGTLIEYSGVVEIYTTNGKLLYVLDSQYVPHTAKNNNWTLVESAWYYVLDNSFCYDDIYEIGGVMYGFDGNGKMFDDEIFTLYEYDYELDYGITYRYYAHAGGRVATKEWAKDAYTDTWYYFGADGKSYESGLTKIGPYYYYFTNDGALCNTIYIGDGVIYLADANCRVTEVVNGWVTHPQYNDITMYVYEGDLLYDCIFEIDGKLYAFDYDGALVKDDFYNTDDGIYLVDADGTVVTKPGWNVSKEGHVLINQDGTLFVGWYNDTYYLSPVMLHSTLVLDYDNNTLYAFALNGQSKAITTDGFYSVPELGTLYVKNGSPVKNSWKSIGGKWYYFDEVGVMLVDGVYTIDDANYFFNGSGQMWDGGWHRLATGDSGSWIYANANGTLYTGKDSAGYVFDDEGLLHINSIVKSKDTWYYTNSDGKAIKTFKEGWNEFGANWYLVVDGELQIDTSYTDSQGRTSCFDSYGVMISDRFYDGRYIAKDGYVKKGWFKLDGKWYYGHPDENGYLAYDGYYYIDDTPYVFSEYVLQQNKTILMYGQLITTDSEGIAIKTSNASGWQYSAYGSEGYVYYYPQGGGDFTGWVGDYFIQYNQLMTGSTVEYGGKVYYLAHNGLLKRNGWINVWGNEWCYARADGSLYINEWLSIGGKYYYFDSGYMLYDGIYTIDGKDYEFNKDGVYLREVKKENHKDGWVASGKDWYYYIAGEKVVDEEIYYNNAWYCFDYYGKMITNKFDYTYNYYDSLYFYYYTADGSRATYTGWKTINGKWVYFNKDSSVSVGWIKDGNKWYYQSIEFDNKYQTECIAMATGYKVIDGTIYNFSSSGSLVNAVTQDGWHYLNNAWYYIENGKITYGEKKIKNVTYAFNYDGKMVANGCFEGKFYNADGAQITKAGWYKIGNEWIYVLPTGRVAEYGIFLIDKKEYSFYDGVWVG